MGCWEEYIFLIVFCIVLKIPIPLVLQYQETAVLAEAHMAIAPQWGHNIFHILRVQKLSYIHSSKSDKALVSQI